MIFISFLQRTIMLLLFISCISILMHNNLINAKGYATDDSDSSSESFIEDDIFDEDDIPPVLELTSDTFKAALDEYDVVFVLFYAPWCRHCRALAPEFIGAAQQLPDDNKNLVDANRLNVKFARVDVTEDPDFADRLSVINLPTIRLYRRMNDREIGTEKGDEIFSNFKLIPFTGSKTVAGMLSWLKLQLGPPFTIINTREQLDSMVKKEDAVVVAFFAENDNDPREVIFQALAEKDPGHAYAIVSKSSLMAEYGAKHGQVFVLRTFDGDLARMPADNFGPEALATFVRQEANPRVHEFSQKSSRRIFSAGIHSFFMIVSDSDYPEFNQHMEMFRKVSQEFREKIIFVHINSKKGLYDDIVRYLEVNRNKTPAYLIFQLDNAKKIKPEKMDFTEANVRKFVIAYLASNQANESKKATDGQKGDENYVQELSSSDFEAVTLDAEKDVFVMLFGDNCDENCKKLQDIWNHLGEIFKERTDKTVAKIDVANHPIHHQGETKSLPQLKLFRSQDNRPLLYKGERVLESLVKFLEKPLLDDPMNTLETNRKSANQIREKRAIADPIKDTDNVATSEKKDDDNNLASETQFKRNDDEL